MSGIEDRAIMSAVQALEEPVITVNEAATALVMIADFGQSNGLDAEQCRGLRFVADLALLTAGRCSDGWRKLHAIAADSVTPLT